MSENELSQSSCFICNRPSDQLPTPPPEKPKVPEKLVMVWRHDYFGNNKKSVECWDCRGVPIYPYEVYGSPYRFLLWHMLDNDTWKTPVFKYIDTRLDRLFAGEFNPNEDSQSLDLEEDPAHNYEWHILLPEEVEKIKAAPGCCIIVWPIIDDCPVGPPELIDNCPKSPDEDEASPDDVSDIDIPF